MMDLGSVGTVVRGGDRLGIGGNVRSESFWSRAIDRRLGSRLSGRGNIAFRV